MRCLLQRVSHARVEVAGEVVGEIDSGLVALIGVTASDTAEEVELLVRKTVAARLFPAEEKPFDRSVADQGGAILVVSQFTLYGDLRRGNRPSWSAAARPEEAEPLVEAYAAGLEAAGLRVARGQFGAEMRVQLTNEGPVTLLLDTAEWARPRRS